MIPSIVNVENDSELPRALGCTQEEVIMESVEMISDAARQYQTAIREDGDSDETVVKAQAVGAAKDDLRVMLRGLPAVSSRAALTFLVSERDEARASRDEVTAQRNQYMRERNELRVHLSSTEAAPATLTGLNLEQRDEIKLELAGYVNAVAIYQQTRAGTGTGDVQAAAADVELTRDRVNHLLDDATTTKVDHRLLERTRERDDARTSLESVNRRWEAARARAEAAVTELEQFKKLVSQVATDAAEEHQWCAEIDRVLEKLGLERVKKQYKARLTVTIDFTATIGAGNATLIPGRGWVRDSVSEHFKDSIYSNFEMDSDHDSSEVDEVNYSVDNIEEIN